MAKRMQMRGESRQVLVQSDMLWFLQEGHKPQATRSQVPEAAEASGSDAEGEPRAWSPQKKKRRKGKAKHARPSPSMFQDLL